jgi:hypothetical protein
MSLQIRRGTENQRTSMPLALAQGELAYTTDTKRLFVGDGATIGGTPVAPVTSVNGFNGVVVLTADSLANGDTNRFFSNELSNAATASLLVNSTHTGLTISYNSQTSALTITNPNIINPHIISTGALAFYAAPGKTISPSQSITWDENNNILQLLNGTLTSTRNISGLNSAVFDTYATGHNFVAIRRSRGTNITPTTITSTDVIGSLLFQGYDGTQFTTLSSISVNTNGAVSDGIVPGLFRITTNDIAGNIDTRLAINSTGLTTLGPYYTTEGGSGSLLIRQTISSQTEASISVRNYFSDQYGASLVFRKYRGTFASPTVVLNGDILGKVSARGFDGTNGILTSEISFVADGAISTTIVPSAITFKITNSSGLLVQTTKIGSNGVLTHNGSITTNSAPGTIWNYDSSSSTITMTIGQTLAFANFSGTVLVNCYNSGTVTQYFCGGGGTPIAHGSSKVTNTGTMAATSGISGYTFTATEAGVHSFYVIRTRTGA